MEASLQGTGATARRWAPIGGVLLGGRGFTDEESGTEVGAAAECCDCVWYGTRTEWWMHPSVSDGQPSP